LPNIKKAVTFRLIVAYTADSYSSKDVASKSIDNGDIPPVGTFQSIRFWWILSFTFGLPDIGKPSHILGGAEYRSALYIDVFGYF